MRLSPPLGVLLLACCCSEANESSTQADYRSIRVRDITLSDATGKSVVTLTADTGSNGVPRLIVRDARGAVLQTIEVGASQ